ncbi:MAG TPA: phytoene/squalene synthase family protein [Candidatus Acidoferrales bacterium]|nr:phytoene/squalene synthase family protein [Candidatus Acidoferrales bacterium]
MPELASAPAAEPRGDESRKSWVDDDDFQAAMLEGVSRTFALTIPQLPPSLRRVVANAYLLCRIVDTIEDEPALSATQKQYFCRQFLKTVSAEDDGELFSAQLAGLLSSHTTPAEAELIRNVPRVVRITRRFSPPQRRALERCVRIMAEGMGQFQLSAGKHGLQSLEDLDRYCYCVAGVVGQMLTELFCLHSPAIAKQHERLMALAVSFGQGLQMTNILKDLWEDYRRGACWLPRKVFAEEGFDLGDLPGLQNRAEFERGVRRLVGIAHGHLRNALAYTLLIPKEETGIRNFCLWAVGLAVLTLRKINSHLSYTAGSEVKISRASVKATILATRLARQNNTCLKLLFYLAARPLPPPFAMTARPPFGKADENAAPADP